ncbi:hypothetical protein [Acinetobacter ihumii]|nr:hypothetical protein [Acinetobacter ihumii]
MLVKSQAAKARPAWKTFLVELLTVRAGLYISQTTDVQVNKRGHLG